MKSLFKLPISKNSPNKKIKDREFEKKNFADYNFSNAKLQVRGWI